MYTTGFLQNYLKGQKLGPNPRPRKIIIIKVVVIHDFGSPNSHPIISEPRHKIDCQCHPDIKEAISATNSNWEVFFCIGQNTVLVWFLHCFLGFQSLKLKTAETNRTLNFISNYLFLCALCWLLHLNHSSF
jgi:hypothetical protein